MEIIKLCVGSFGLGIAGYLVAWLVFFMVISILGLGGFSYSSMKSSEDDYSFLHGYNYVAIMVGIMFFCKAFSEC